MRIFFVTDLYIWNYPYRELYFYICRFCKDILNYDIILFKVFLMAAKRPYNILISM